VQKSEPVESFAAFLRAERARSSGRRLQREMRGNGLCHRNPSETIEQGKLKEATYAETYRKQVADLELPALQWKESRAA